LDQGADEGEVTAWQQTDDRPAWEDEFDRGAGAREAHGQQARCGACVGGLVGGGAGSGRGQATFPGVERGQGDAFEGAELRGVETGVSEAIRSLNPGLSCGGTGARGRGGVRRGKSGFGHERPPEDRATSGRYSTCQGRDPRGAYREVVPGPAQLRASQSSQ